MKIALANNLYYPFNRGGAETVVKKMITDLKSQGHDVFLISTKRSSDATPVNTDLKIYYLNSLYLDLASIPPYQRVFWHLTNIFSLKNAKTFKNILEIEKPNLVITHNLMGLGYLLPSVIKNLKIPHIHYLHDIQLLYPTGLMMLGSEKIVDGFSAKIYQMFTRSLFASPLKIISPSSWLLEQHRQRGFFHDSKIEIKKLNENERVVKNSKIKKNFLFVGQIEYHKGIILLIKAFLMALGNNHDLSLKIIGDGALLSEAKTLANENTQIKFLGRLESSEVNEIMKNSDCLIIPSLCYENAPMTILEAHNADLSVLAANIGGIPELMNINDILFNPGDIIDLKEKIIKNI